ncbi:CCD81 protein, partial [Trogon melanurus]|nr:CCD81 protein [Trogon melanurus]
CCTWEMLGTESAQLLPLLPSSSFLPDEMKRVTVTYKRILSDVPYPEEVVQNCMQETLNFMSFVLTNREDVDLVLKDFGTLAIRGREVTMAFCEDFILRLNKSTYVAEKLLSVSFLVFQCSLEWV